MAMKSSTLWSPNDTVKDAAETLGINNLPEEVAKALAMDIEYRLHEVIEQAMKFMRHSKRTVLSTRDISAALKVLNIEPLYGYENGRPLAFGEAMLGAGQIVYYVDDDDEVDFDKLINEPIPRVPREPTYTAHWLAVEGVQPAIPQNPHVGEIKAIPPQARGSQQTFSSTNVGQDIDVKLLVKHMVSKELQLYFDRVIHVLLDESGPDADSMRETALFSLRNDPGLHQLTPYFVQFIQEKISTQLKTDDEGLKILNTILDVVDALLVNPTIFVDPYVHQIIPSVLTIIVARRLGASSGTESEAASETRIYAAELLHKLSKEFSPKYPTLRPRLTRTLLKGFMDVQRPLASLTGIVRGISALGSEVVRVIIVGNLRPWFEAVSRKAAKSPEDWERLNQALATVLKDAQLPAAPDAEPEMDQDALESEVGEPLAKFLVKNQLDYRLLK